MSVANALAAQCPLQLQPAALTNGAIYSLRTLVNGDVLATGLFTAIGGVAANNLARWNGTSCRRSESAPMAWSP